MNSSFPALQIVQGRDFTMAQAQEWARLMDEVWPSPDGSRSAAKALAEQQEQDALHVAGFDSDSKMICHAALFGRDMSSATGTMRVGCLASVCVRPDRRGHGLGREVVSAAFQALPQIAPVVLFQTGVPAFYLKLGARVVTNRFVNAHAQEPERNPFWEAHVMIYPGGHKWPESTIDIGGSGF